MKNSGTVRMETKRLVLRPFVIEDAGAMFRNWANDPQVTKFLSWEPHKDVEEEVVGAWNHEGGVCGADSVLFRGGGCQPRGGPARYAQCEQRKGHDGLRA